MPSIPVDDTLDACSFGRQRVRRCERVPDQIAVLADVDDGHARQHPGVVRLPTAGGVERGAIERYRVVAAGDDPRVELAQIRVAQEEQLGTGHVVACSGVQACVPTLSSRNGVSLGGPGSFGSPSTRSPMMFFWISSVPP